MKPLLIATTNVGKIQEFQLLLKSHFDCIAPDERAPFVLEDGTTYQENAQKKAKAFYQVFKTPVLADDSGVEVDALNGEPGLFSARYGGEKLSWPERWDFLYRKLKKVPAELRTARFRAVLCYFDGKNIEFFESTTEGSINDSPKGEQGFGYDPVFYSLELEKSFGEASEIEKAQVSHRAKACRLFLKWYQGLS